MDLLLDLWARLTVRQAPLPLPAAWLTIAAAAMIVLVPVLWRACRNVVTIAHEGGHALVATLGGRQLDGIRLHSDTSGLTVSRGKPRGLGMVLTLLADYSSPALLVTAFLLLGAVRTVLELQGSRSRRGGTASDADQLAA